MGSLPPSARAYLIPGVADARTLEVVQSVLDHNERGGSSAQPEQLTGN